jgi:prevent-host-death family protein
VTKIGIRELKARAPQVVREVRETGEPIDITYRGEVVARLIPVEIARGTGTFETAWKEFDAVARAVGKRTKRAQSRSSSDWRRRL